MSGGKSGFWIGHKNKRTEVLMAGRIEKICSFVLMSKNKSANAILTICQSNTFRISFLDTVTHTDEKTRFSRALQNPLCRSFPSLRLLPAYKAIIPCASRYTPRKLGAFPANHLVTRIWIGTGFHLKEKQALGAHLRTARCRFFQQHADKYKKSCANKKCFFSRTKNLSAETDS